MAIPSISVADFVGEIRINKDVYGEADAQAVIDERYPEIIRCIIGDYAYSEIDATNPLPAKWADLLNGVTYTDSERVQWINEGLVKASKYMLFCSLFIEDFQNTTTGNVVNYNENSTRLSGGSVSVVVAKRYNKAVNAILSAYYFIVEFSKIEQDFTAVVDNGDNTYTFDVPSTKYLAVGDTVWSDGTELTVTAITANVDITADAGETGISFSIPIYWQPFEKYKMPLPHYPKSSAI